MFLFSCFIYLFIFLFFLYVIKNFVLLIIGNAFLDDLETKQLIHAADFWFV